MLAAVVTVTILKQRECDPTHVFGTLHRVEADKLIIGTMWSVRACLRLGCIVVAEIVLLVLVNVLCMLNYAVRFVSLRHYRTNNEFVLHRLATVIVWVLESVAGVKMQFSGDADFFSKTTRTETVLMLCNHTSHLGPFTFDLFSYRSGAFTKKVHTFVQHSRVVCCRADWPTLFAVAVRMGCAGQVKFMVKAIAQYIPLVGWAGRFVECIFVKRNKRDDLASVSAPHQKFFQQSKQIVVADVSGR